MIAICNYSLSRLKCIICVKLTHIHALRIIIKLESIILLLVSRLYNRTYGRPIALQGVGLCVLSNVLNMPLVDPSLFLADRAIRQIWLFFVVCVLWFLAQIALVIFGVFGLGLSLRIECLLCLLRPTLRLVGISVRSTLLLKVCYVSLMEYKTLRYGCFVGELLLVLRLYCFILWNDALLKLPLLNWVIGHSRLVIFGWLLNLTSFLIQQLFIYLVHLILPKLLIIHHNLILFEFLHVANLTFLELLKLGWLGWGRQWCLLLVHLRLLLEVLVGLLRRSLRVKSFKIGSFLLGLAHKLAWNLWWVTGYIFRLVWTKLFIDWWFGCTYHPFARF